jgi:dTMP kinase
VTGVSEGRPRFISFEGPDGSGKTTQINLLAEALRNAGRDVVQTREPGGSPQAEALRALLVSGDIDRWDARAEALLHNAARVEHLRATVRPALKAGAWVLSDRFADSTLAYQGYGHGVDRDALITLQSFATQGLMPGLTLMLDVPLETGAERTGARNSGEDRYERMGDGFHDRVRNGFLAIARADPERVRVIDATADPRSVHQACRAAVSSHFGEDAFG